MRRVLYWLSAGLLCVVVPSAVAGCALEDDAAELGTVENELTFNGLSAVVAVSSSWSTGYCAEVALTNVGTAPINGWEVQLDLGAATFANGWSATLTATGNKVSARPLSWNGTLNPGGKSSFGFCANASSANARPSVLAVAANGGPLGSGGTTGAGGTTGSGGTTSTGGTTSSGGRTTSGGATSTGGTSNTGGTTNTGGAPATCALPTSFRWQSSGVLVGPKSDATHALVSVKDPTVVYYGGKYHVYATTANTAGGWNMVYLSFADWSQASSAPHYYMDATPGFSGYHCAPHVFYFRPQNRWYLVQQSQPPQFSTTTNIADPKSWTRPQYFYPNGNHLPAGAPSLPIDYHVICDASRCYLFFTGDNGKVYRASTSLSSFPNGFGELTTVMSGATNDLFEASIAYKLKGQNKYLFLVEAIGARGRYYRSWTSDRLDGTWSPLAATEQNPFAGANNVSFASGVTDWSDDVSHGELLRDGYDETMTLDTCNLKFLYQGRDPRANTSYSQLPYRLGLLSKTN